MEGALRRARAPRARLDERRERIMCAIRGCMLERGYSRTTLLDVARAAEMTSSHVLYYFKNKEAVLNAYIEELAGRIQSNLDALEPMPLPERLDAVADFFFKGTLISRAELAITFEFFGLAVHHKQLHATKTEFDRTTKAWFTRLFETTARPFDAPPENSAEAAFAMLIGLCTSTFFDENLEIDRVHRLYRNTLRFLAGYPTVQEIPA